MDNEPIVPALPFVWPPPQVSIGASRYHTEPPFEDAVRAASIMFGVVSAIDDRAIEWLDELLANCAGTTVRLVISLHPTCRTSEAALQKLLLLATRHGERAAFRVYPETSLEQRSANLLCLCGADGNLAISAGPTENLGFAPAAPSHANVITQVAATTFEACRKWFDYLWGVAGQLRPDIVRSLPRLTLPRGDIEAAQQWDSFRKRCLEQNGSAVTVTQVVMDPQSGDVVLLDAQGDPLPSPTDEIGVPALDAFAVALARIYEQGSLAAFDKLSRIPPLEAPVKPSWFGVDSFHQTGMVRARTSIKVAPFDEATLRKIDRLRRAPGELLPRFSFSLSDGMRWIPKKAIPLFEDALALANEDAKKFFRESVGNNVESFLASQRERIQADAQRMYEVYRPGSKMPEEVVQDIIGELKSRLGKTNADRLVPQVAYSSIAFHPHQSSNWSSPWGQAFALLKSIAEFPRSAMTDPFFWKGLKTDEDSLIQAMDVAGDHLVRGYGSREAGQRAALELAFIKRLEGASCNAESKCRALWALITAGRTDDVPPGPVPSLSTP